MTTQQQEPIANKPITITLQGYEAIDKIAKPCATSARIIVPKDWIGKKVKVIKLEP